MLRRHACKVLNLMFVCVYICITVFVLQLALSIIIIYLVLVGWLVRINKKKIFLIFVEINNYYDLRFFFKD